MKVLILKSVVGAIITLLMLVIFIPLWNINGACITSSVAHFVGSAIIVVYFFILKKKEENIILKI
jgi:O-antigen/teichoic acid export membrane protein